MNNDIQIKTNDTDGFFCGLETDIHEAKQAGLRSAGYVLKTIVKQSFRASGIHDGINPRYSD